MPKGIKRVVNQPIKFDIKKVIDELPDSIKSQLEGIDLGIDPMKDQIQSIVEKYGRLQDHEIFIALYVEYHQDYKITDVRAKIKQMVDKKIIKEVKDKGGLVHYKKVQKQIKAPKPKQGE